MKKTVIVLSAIALCISLAFGQAGGAKRAELSKLDVMVGNWQGSGEAYMAPGAPPMSWTSTSSSSWILNGHFVLSDLRIDFEGVPTPLILRSVHGWDEETGPFAFNVSNADNGGNAELFWLDDSTLLTVQSGRDDEGLFMERWVTKFAGDTQTFTGEKASGTGELALYVKGTMKRADATFSATSEAATVAMIPPGSEIQRLQPMIGSYDVIGKRAAMPGAPLESFESRLDLDWILGGKALSVSSTSGGAALGFVSWNPNKGCYDYRLFHENGIVLSQEGRWTDPGTLVFTTADAIGGMPGVQRTTVRVKAGSLVVASAERMHGDRAATITFKAQYKRRGAEPARATLEKTFTAGSCCAKAAASGKACAHLCCVTAAKEGRICSSCN